MKQRKRDMFEAESWIMMLLPIVFLIGLILTILTVSMGARLENRATQPSGLEERVER